MCDNEVIFNCSLKTKCTVKKTVSKINFFRKITDWFRNIFRKFHNSVHIFKCKKAINDQNDNNNKNDQREIDDIGMMKF